MNPPRYPARAPAPAPAPVLLAPAVAAGVPRSPSPAANAINANGDGDQAPAKNFAIIKEIGRGSYGSVYLVERRCEGGKKYALKQQRLLNVSEAERAAALQEARFLASVKHPNVVKQREVFLSSGHMLNIVMDLAKGGDVGKLVEAARVARDGPGGGLPARSGAAATAAMGLPEPLVWSLLLQTAAGLAACHALGLLHRDVKPGNVLLMSPCPPSLSGLPQSSSSAAAAAAAPSPSPSPSPSSFPLLKVADLGVAKDAAVAVSNVGTPLYMAPEIYAGRPYGSACDAWSLGVMAYQMCALRVPFGGSARNKEEVRARVLDGRYLPLPVLAAGAGAVGAGAAAAAGGGGGYSPALVRLVDGLLSRDPTRRPTCADVVAGPWTRAWAWTLPEEARAAILAGPKAQAALRPEPGGRLLPAIHHPRDLPGKNYSTDGGVAPPAAPAAAALVAAPAAPPPPSALPMPRMAAAAGAAKAVPPWPGRGRAGAAAAAAGAAGVRPVLGAAAAPYAYSPGGAALVRPPSAAAKAAVAGVAAGSPGAAAAAAAVAATAAAAKAAKTRAAAAAVPSWMK